MRTFLVILALSIGCTPERTHEAPTTASPTSTIPASAAASPTPAATHWTGPTREEAARLNKQLFRFSEKQAWWRLADFY
jgi:hypothetical protein